MKFKVPDYKKKNNNAAADRVVFRSARLQSIVYPSDRVQSSSVIQLPVHSWFIVLQCHLHLVETRQRSVLTSNKEFL